MGITQFISSPHAPPLSRGSTQGIVVYRVQIQGRHRWQWLPNYSIYNHQNKHLHLLWHVVSHLFLSSHPYRAPVECLVPETIGLFPDVSTRWDSEWLLGGAVPAVIASSYTPVSPAGRLPPIYLLWSTRDALRRGGLAPLLSVALSNLHCILSIKGSTLIDSHQWWLQAWLPFGYHGIVMLEWALSPLFLLCSGHIYSSGRMHMYRKHRRGPFGACLCSTTNVVLLYLLSSV